MPFFITSIERAAQGGLVGQALVDQHAIERHQHRARADLGRRAVLEVDGVRHAARQREDRGPREPLIQHVDQEVDEGRPLQRALRRRGGRGGGGRGADAWGGGGAVLGGGAWRGLDGVFW